MEDLAGVTAPAWRAPPPPPPPQPLRAALAARRREPPGGSERRHLAFSAHAPPPGKGPESPVAKFMIGGLVTIIFELSGGHFMEVRVGRERRVSERVAAEPLRLMFARRGCEAGCWLTGDARAG